MKKGLGSKGGKTNRIITFLNNKRRKRKLIIEEELKAKNEEDNKKKKEKIINNSNNNIEVKPKVIFTPTNFKVKLEQKNKIKKNEDEDKKVEKKLEFKEIIVEKEIKKDNVTEKNIEQPNRMINQGKENKESEEESNYLEQQVLEILKLDIEDKRYELKKLDNEVYILKKELERENKQEDLDKINLEIEKLMELIKEIRRKIRSLEKTFKFKYPIEHDNNYLIQLVDEYKEKRKIEKNFYKKLEDSKEFNSLTDMIVNLENNIETLQEKVKNEKENLNIGEEYIKNLSNDMISIEEIEKNIEVMINKQKEIMTDLERKLNETVNITEKVDYISKSVDHSIFELFLLMSIFKHNLSLKNNALAATIAMITFNEIMRITTPIEERVTYKENDIHDYKSIILSCINDTGNLEKLILSNLDQLSSIRYKFQKYYKDFSYLDSYKEAISKLDILEIDMKDRKKDVEKMRKETQLQLEKNNSKIKKYTA